MKRCEHISVILVLIDRKYYGGQSDYTGHFERGMKPVFSNLFYRRVWQVAFTLPIFITALAGLNVKSASAATNSCIRVPLEVANSHLQTQFDVTSAIVQDFSDHRQWLTTTFAQNNVIPALQLFAEQMTAVAAHQTMLIGMFFDSKHQLESQRLFQELQVQAHKDYQPSTNFCAFGTNVRSLAHSESVGRYNAIFMAQRQLRRHLGQENAAGARGGVEDKEARWIQFVSTYCDPQDNGWTGVANDGLASVCNATDANRVNRDIDYTRMIENRRTLDIVRRFDVGSPDELDVLALGNNLYGNDVLFRNVDRDSIVDDTKQQQYYMDLRAIAARRSVAENSYNAIIGMKSIGNTTGLLDVANPGDRNTWEFLGSIITDLGVDPAEVADYIGPQVDLPPAVTAVHQSYSYYAQLEILAKKIYQNPDFYANLYDKPANVKRISTALKAIDLMLDRAIYESQLRQEMTMSVLLSSRLRMRFDDIDNNLGE